MGLSIDYYEVLGISRNSDDVEIKKAYRRLALKYHPDVDMADEAAAEFALVGEAYDVLSQPKHKGVYDLYGAQKLKSGVEGDDPYAFDVHAGPRAVFERFFGTNNPYEALEVLSTRFERLTTPKPQPTPPPKTVELPATLEELYTGCTKVVVHSRLAAPSSGGDPVAEPRRLSVAIEPGMPDGTTFMFEGEGEPSGPGQPPGPLALVLKASRHERFERSGCDLVARVKLPLFNALAGGAVPVKTLDGRVLNVPLDEIITPGTTIRVPGEGLPKPGGGGAKGDLVLGFDLLFPSNLTQQQKLLLKGALFLPPKLDAVQAKALRAFDSAFRDSQHGWSTGVLPGEEGGS